MNRRELLTVSVALAVTGPTLWAGEVEHVAYERQAYEQAVASDKPLMLDFYAHW